MNWIELLSIKSGGEFISKYVKRGARTGPLFVIRVSSEEEVVYH
jgi:hypothetical protein